MDARHGLKARLCLIEYRQSAFRLSLYLASLQAQQARDETNVVGAEHDRVGVLFRELQHRVVADRRSTALFKASIT